MIITEETKEKQIKQLAEIIKHPLIQRRRVLSAVLGVSPQRLNGWMIKGISKDSIALINSNKELEIVSNTQTIEKKEWLKIKRKQVSQSRKFCKLMNIHDICERAKVSIHSVSMCRLRNQISLTMAKRIAEATKDSKSPITIEEMRPDIPALAIKYGVQRW